MANLERYEVAGSLLLCRTCGVGDTRHIVKNFAPQTIGVAEMHVEIAIHENDFHEAVFANDATENAMAAKRASRALALRAEAAAQEVRDNAYYACYPVQTAYRDGVVNGLGGSAGDLAGVLAPEVAHALARALDEVHVMGRSYDELIRDHDRKTCDDFTCSIFGYLVDVARAVDAQLN
ncbi:hypothetical protein [Streptomyces cucumeris]|uniref:hypothetical protein n=1 Tax=Streptomyces cucumeris TaxID=2962890 RepID=UPI0020C8A1B6|nr:hypothetical protein [Streptomyces sp. NEAU-Y11]MCP9209518.1 hypothetical protein [Streptomyces sp. NEAU-Y11]